MAQYERPVVQLLESLNPFFNHSPRRPLKRRVDVDWRVEKLRAFIDNHPAEGRRTLDCVCRQLEIPLSERQVRRLFKAFMGIGIKEYAKEKKLARAFTKLQVTDAPIKVIAADLGYEKTGHLSRSFKDFFRLGPMEFRRVWRGQ